MERALFKKMRSFGCTRAYGKDFKHHARSTHNDRKLESRLIRTTLKRNIVNSNLQLMPFNFLI